MLYTSLNDNKIGWYENNGNGNFNEEEHIVSTDVISATSVYAIYLDGDGDNDILSASRDDNKIAWYENLLEAVGIEPIKDNTTTITATGICTIPNNSQYTPSTLQIQFNAPQTEPTTVQAYDIMGHLIGSQVFNATKGINTWQIEIQNYPKGIYLVRVGNRSVSETVRVVCGR